MNKNGQTATVIEQAKRLGLLSTEQFMTIMGESLSTARLSKNVAQERGQENLARSQPKEKV